MPNFMKLHRLTIELGPHDSELRSLGVIDIQCYRIINTLMKNIIVRVYCISLFWENPGFVFHFLPIKLVYLTSEFL